MRAKACLLAVLLATAASAGCAEYKYYDISVAFNTAPPMNFMGATDVSTVQNCVVEVSGADSAEYLFGRDQNCPPQPAGSATTMGTFEYSSTADSGSLTFTFKAYVGPALQECLVGQGVTTVAVGATTSTGMIKVDRINEIKTCQ